MSVMGFHDHCDENLWSIIMGTFLSYLNTRVTLYHSVFWGVGVGEVKQLYLGIFIALHSVCICLQISFCLYGI